MNKTVTFLTYLLVVLLSVSLTLNVVHFTQRATNAMIAALAIQAINDAKLMDALDQAK